MDAKELYKDAIAALNYTDAKHSFERGFYRAPPDGLGQHLAERLRVERSAQIMVLGGIGTGKSTLLLSAARALDGDTAAFYLDVSRYVRLLAPRPGVLVALACLARLRLLREAGVQLPASLRSSIARVHAGLAAPVNDDVGLLDHEILRGEPDALTGSLVSVEDLARHYESLGRLDRSIAARPVVLLCDGLDRVQNVSVLNEFISEDLPTLRRAGVGVALVGSIAWRFGLDRELRVSPDAIRWQRIPDPEGNAEELAFMSAVLRARVASALVPDPIVALLARGSGGVMRDFIALTKDALTTARSAERAEVEAGDVHSAFEALAERRLLFLSDDRLDVVRRIFEGADVTGTTRALEDLLASCDVLPRDLPNRYAIHPVVREVLERRRKVA